MNLLDDRKPESAFSAPWHNLLPYDGCVEYRGLILSEQKANDYFQHFMQCIQWRHDEAVIFGKRICTKRKAAWYGDGDYSYTYSGVEKTALPWTDALLELKAAIEANCGEHFNSCLLNLYHDGSEGMAWHSDGETALKKNGTIASLSLGAARRFLFKHKQTGEKVETLLAHGSLLLMKGTTQSNWLHHLPVSRKVHTPRINLTFRSMSE